LVCIPVLIDEEELEKEVHGLQGEEVRVREGERERERERQRRSYYFFLSPNFERERKEAGNAVVLLLGPRGARRIRAASSS
jgi:hypothetical protein